ncbi:MAG: hypothetical protein AAF696_16860, partial [Bacteroidota bacterium]
MIKHVFCLLLLLAFSYSAKSQAFLWMFTDGGPAEENIRDLTVDKFGNIYVLGTFDFNLELGNGDTSIYVPPSGTRDALFLAKYDVQREFEWVRVVKVQKTANPQGSFPYFLDIDSLGRVRLQLNLSSIALEVELLADTLIQINNNPKSFSISYNSSGSRQDIQEISNSDTGYIFRGDQGELFISGIYSRFDPWDFWPDSIFVDGRWLNDPLGGGYIGKVNLDGQISLLVETVGVGGVGGTIERDIEGNYIMEGGFGDSLFIQGQKFPLASETDYGKFIAKFDSSGNLMWHVPLYPLIPDESTIFITQLESDKDANIYFLGTFTGEFQIDSDTIISIPSPQPFSRVGKTSVFLGKLDPNGNLLWLKSSNSFSSYNISFMEAVGEDEFVFHGSSSWSHFEVFDSLYVLGDPNSTNVLNHLIYFDKNGQVTSTLELSPFQPAVRRPDEEGNIYLGRYFQNSIQVGPFTTPSVQRNNFLVTKIGRNPNVIEGKVFRDRNQNGIQDMGEEGMEGVAFQRIPDSLVFFTDDSGRYSTYVDTGSFSISPAFVPYHSISPSTYSTQFLTSGNRDTAHFAAIDTPLVDLEGIMTLSARARIGFRDWIQLQVKNLGTSEYPVQIKLLLDEKLDSVSSDIPLSYSLGDTLVWELDSIGWRDKHVINIFSRVQINTAFIGTYLRHELWVGPLDQDIDVSNNYYSDSLQITGAYDPNDKQASPSGNIPPSDIQQGQWLDYTIRFQNVGNDTAFNIVIKDTLDRKLDLGTLQMTAASHPYFFLIENNRSLSITFPDVLLVDSTTNEADSHG